MPGPIKSWTEAISPPCESAWRDYIAYFVRPDIIRLVGRFLMPAFVEHEGGVFLSDGFTLSGYSDWKEKLGDVTAVERIMNHRHVCDLFITDDQISDESFEAVAKLMAQSLRLALLGSYPDRAFDVYVSNDDDDYGPIVGFHSV